MLSLKHAHFVNFIVLICPLLRNSMAILKRGHPTKLSKTHTAIGDQIHLVQMVKWLEKNLFWEKSVTFGRFQVYSVYSK